MKRVRERRLLTTVSSERRLSAQPAARSRTRDQDLPILRLLDVNALSGTVDFPMIVVVTKRRVIRTAEFELGFGAVAHAYNGG